MRIDCDAYGIKPSGIQAPVLASSPVALEFDQGQLLLLYEQLTMRPSPDESQDGKKLLA